VDLRTLHERLYLANAAVLLVHQMDAAYWHEWRMFGLPGGISLYLILNIPIAFAVLAGYGAVAAGRKSAVPLSWLLVAAGMFAAVFHAFHLLRGDPAFRTPVSVALLADTFLLSAVQAGVLVALRRRERARLAPV
jgi:4-amino-4-deoxy-L-arabinose transferase-like glycosyltransferase